jgi:uracil-DNA glycosylase family 4
MIGPTRDIIDTIIKKVDARLIHTTDEDGAPSLSSLPYHCIINAVQCHPVNNINPTANQITKCYHHVVRYISLAQPTLIVLCGSIALQYLMSPLVTYRSQKVQQYYGVIHVPHPAFILRERNDIRRNRLMTDAADIITNLYEDSKVKRSNQ